MTIWHWIVAGLVSHSAVGVGSIWGWGKYKAKVAADLAKVVSKV